MIENFPELNEGEVALLRAEVATGHVLDEQYKLAVNDSQKTYTVISNMEEALNIVKGILVKRKDIECVIYGKNKQVLSYLNPQNIDAI